MKVTYAKPRIGKPNSFNEKVRKLIVDQIKDTFKSKKFNIDNLYFSYSERTDIAWCGYRSILNYVYTENPESNTWIDYSVGLMNKQSELNGKLRLDRLPHTACTWVVTKANE